MSPHEVWHHWGAGPLELALLVLPALWYAVGVRALWRSAGRGRGVTHRQVTAFFIGILTLAVALASPLDAMAEALFSGHMVQHLLLILVAAPCCVLGAPVLPMLWALPRARRRALARWWHRRAALRAIAHTAAAPGVVFAAHTAALWFWHFPAPYQAALEQPVMHAIEHLSFFGTAALFWWTVAPPTGRRRASEGAGILLISGTLMQGGALGAVLMLARAPWYPAHAEGARAWGLTLLEDQQLAGILMWVPASLVYVAAAAWLFLRWMRRDERAHAAQGAARRTLPRVAAVAGAAVALFLCTACGSASGHPTDRVVENGDATRGRDAITSYGCGSCHAIPGIQGADGMVGPSLEHWAERRMIAGEVPNDPARLITWITVPQSIEPGTAMPNMGVTDGQARDIAAYLYTLH